MYTLFIIVVKFLNVWLMHFILKYENHLGHLTTEEFIVIRSVYLVNNLTVSVEYITV